MDEKYIKQLCDAFTSIAQSLSFIANNGFDDDWEGKGLVAKVQTDYQDTYNDLIAKGLEDSARALESGLNDIACAISEIKGE